MTKEIILHLSQTLGLLGVFLVCSFFVFYLTGYRLVKKIKNNLTEDEVVVLSFGLGWVLFLIGYSIFSLFKLPWLFFLFLLLLNFKTILEEKSKILRTFRELSRQKFLIFILILGTLVEGFINFPSGFPYKDGHLYWSAQGHDGLWHVAVIEAIKRNFPPENPLYSGEKLFNYHYFSDIIMAGFSQFFPFFNVLDLYYRFFPFLISFLMGLSAYSFLTTWSGKKKVGLWGIFFTYFVGSFGYIVLLVQKRGFLVGGETIFWAAQSNTIIGNPPHAFCFVLIPALFLALIYFWQQPTFYKGAVCFLLGGFLAGFKVLAGVVASAGIFGGLVTFLFLNFIKRKKDTFPKRLATKSPSSPKCEYSEWQNKYLILGVGLAIVITNLVVFKLLTKKGESFLVFEPWWFIRTMVVAPDRLNWIDLELRRQFYAERGGIRAFLRIIQFESTAFLIFLVGNLGMRIFGWIEIFKMFWKKKFLKDPLVLILLIAAATAFIIPMLFVQRGVAYNMIQFMQYFLLIFGFFAAFSVSEMYSVIKSKILKFIFVLLIVLASIPTVAGNLIEFYGKNALAIVKNEEVEALCFLKKRAKKTDVVLTKPFDKYSFMGYPHQPWPISVWSSTAYVSAYASVNTFLTDEGQVAILGIDPEERIKELVAFFDPKISLSNKTDFLRKNRISFIYLRKEERSSDLEKVLEKLPLEKIFENREVKIYKVNTSS